MTDTLCGVLESFGYPLFLHGTLNDGEAFPDSFFTYYNSSTPERMFYDNDAHEAVWTYQVYFYSTDRRTAETVIEQARTALKAEGFIPNGKSIDCNSGQKTHTGRMITIRAIENYEQ